MKGLVVNAEWAPRPGYWLTDREAREKRANVGSQVWRYPSFEFREMAVPDVGYDELLIRVKRCGICGSDTHLYETDSDGYILFSGPVRLPCIIGHEYSGVVEKVGNGVVNFKPGDRVAAESVLWCGVCSTCRSGAVNQCERVELAGITSPGAFAEFIVTKERHCWNINGLLDVYEEEKAFDVGALIEPTGCAYNGLFISGGGFMPGAVVTVFGAGPIGLAAVALAKIAGASQVIAFDPINERLELAKKMGADLVFNVSKPNFTPGEKILEMTRGRGADVQVEAAGGTSTIPEMERSLAANGKIIYLGRAATNSSLNLNLFVSGANKVIGSRGHSGYGIYSNIIRLIESNRLNLDGMITSTFCLKEVLSALKKSSDRTDGKIVIEID